MGNEEVADNSDNFIEISIDQIDEMMRENKKDTREGRSLTQSTYNGESFQKSGKFDIGRFYQDYLKRDPLTAGFKIYYPHGVVIEQPSRKNFYRGENQVFTSSVPSLLRDLREYAPGEEQELYRLIADMRIYEFRCLLNRFEHVRYWHDHIGDVLYDTLAQHYNLHTCWLDITSDFDVALFFANCHYDNEDGKWYPLTKAQTEVDKDHKYGVIFQMSSQNMSMRMSEETYSQWMFSDTAADNRISYHGQPRNVALPIGYQPFERCSAQSGYGIYMRNERPLQKDNGFKELRFRHDEKLALRIYKKMNEGKSIYPYEGLTRIEDRISEIGALTDFSEEALRFAVYRSHFFKLKDIDEVRRKLRNFRVDGKEIRILDRHPWKLSALKRKMIDEAYAGFNVWDFYHIMIMERKCYPPAQGVFEPWMLMTESNEPGTVDFRRRKDSDIHCGYSFLHLEQLKMQSTLMTKMLPTY